MEQSLIVIGAVVALALAATGFINYRNRKKAARTKADELREAMDVISDGIEKSATQTEINFWQNEIALAYSEYKKQPGIAFMCSRLHSLALQRSMFLQATQHIKDAGKYL